MSVRRGTALTISFALTDPNNRPAALSGATFAAGDVQISKDGGAFANTTNSPAEIATATGRYSLALTAAEMDAAWVHIFVQNSQVDRADVTIGTDGSPTGTVVADGSNTASTFHCSRAEATDDYWKNTLLVFTSGALAGQVQKVSAFNHTTAFITVSAAFTAAPSTGDRFALINM